MHIEILYRTVKRETAGGREIKYDLIIPHTEKRKIIRKTVRKMKRMHHTNCNKLCKKNKKNVHIPVLVYSDFMIHICSLPLCAGSIVVCLFDLLLF